MGFAALSRLLSAGRTFVRLGPWNAVRVALFRRRARRGYYRKLQPVQALPLISDVWSLETATFKPVNAGRPNAALVEENLAGGFRLFGHELVWLGALPDWFGAVRDGGQQRLGMAHWSDFYLGAWQQGDVKRAWDPSRFNWAIGLARAYGVSGDRRYLMALNERLMDWSRQNPPFSFPNWSCGQETGLRLLALLATDLLLQETGCARGKGLEALVVHHCERIEMTLEYAIAQRNNHAISEAAALFVAGAWLQSSDRINENAVRWRDLGRRLLEYSVTSLFRPDGGFALVSPSYHRAVCDLLALTEILRRYYCLPGFSAIYYSRCEAAARWLASLALGAGGDAPNLGGNDGSLMLDCLEGDYRDFRPASSRLLRVLANPAMDRVSLLWQQEGSEAKLLPVSQRFDDSGLAILERNCWVAMLRFNRPDFRPQHCDSLHLDLWFSGQNILRDGGSFDYSDRFWSQYFCGPAGHNTIEFDGEPPMRQAGQFLFLDWVDAELTGFDVCQGWVAAKQTDYRGYGHHRQVILGDQEVVVLDRIDGNFRSAILRWRLMPGDWRFEDGILSDGRVTIRVEADVNPKRKELVLGWESRYYGERTELTVLELEFDAACTIRTNLSSLL